MDRKSIFSFIFNFILIAAFSQQHKSELILTKDQEQHISEGATYWLQSFDEKEDVKLADSMYHQNAFKYWNWHKTLNLGDVRKRLWVRIKVRNCDSTATNFVWSIHDFLDTATLYMYFKEGFKNIGTATYWDVASKRAFPTRPLCIPFPLPYKESTILYLSIAEHNNNCYFPMHIKSAVNFLKDEEHFIIDQHWFWLVGFYIFSIVFNLILFSFLRDKIYLWYCIYVLFNTIFLLMEDSLDALILPQQLYSLIWHFGQYSFLLLSTASGIKIMQVFIRQKENQFIIYKLGQFFMYISFLFPVLIFLVMRYSSEIRGFNFLNILKSGRDILIFSNLFYILFSLILALYMRKRIALYYGFTYFFFFISSMMFMMNHLGITSINLIQPNILAWGLFFELLTLSILLTARFRHIIQQSALLQMENAEQEKKQTQQLLETQEAERKRIAEDLHDDVGATLSALQLHLSHLSPEMTKSDNTLANYFQKAILLSAKAASDIRSISHDLLPKDFVRLGLFRVLQNRLAELNMLQQIQFNFIMEGDEFILSSPHMITIYRIINEVIRNTIKHSQASEATIQVIIINQEVLIIAEDNGIGLENANDKVGIGLKNIRSRVEFLKGTLSIDSNLKGTSIIINLFVKN